MYLSHGLPRIILAKGFAPAQITCHASFTPKAAPAGATAQIKRQASFTPKAAPASAPAQEGRARSRLTVMSTKGRARRRDRSRLTVHRRDRKRAQTAWLVGEPEAAEIVVGAAKILVRVERPVHIDIDRAFGCVLELRREIARQRLEIGGLRI